MKNVHVELAVISTLLEHGLAAARELIKSEWENVERASKFVPDLFYQLLQVHERNETKQVKKAVLRFYHICMTHKNLTVKHHLTVAMSRRLIFLKKSDIALDLLATVYTSRYRDAAKFSGVFMKMFARAFAELQNLAGIRWTTLSALAQSRTITWDLVVEIRRILGVLHRSVNASSSPEKTEQLEYLDHIAMLLEKKSEGDTSVSELHIDPDKRQQSQPRTGDERRLFKKEDIRETLETWSEVQELEAVLQTGSPGQMASLGSKTRTT